MRYGFLLYAAFSFLTPLNQKCYAAIVPHDGNLLKREKSRDLLKVQCGSCHTPTSATSNAKALKVFDLATADWTNKMSLRQLDRALWMIRERVKMSPKEVAQLIPSGAKVPKVPTTNQIDEFESFIYGEIDARRRSPSSQETKSEQTSLKLTRAPGH